MFGMQSTKCVMREVASGNFNQALDIKERTNYPAECLDVLEAMETFNQERKPVFTDL